MQKKEELSLHFLGDSHEIDATTLITYLCNYQIAVEGACRHFDGGVHDIKLRVAASHEGSFVLDLVVTENLGDLFKDFATCLASIVTVASGIFHLYKHYKGRPVKEEKEKQEARALINVDNVIIKDSVINAYNDKVTRMAVSKSFDALSKDENVEGIEISTKKTGDTVRFSRDTFEEMVYNSFDTEDVEVGEKIIEEEAVLQVASLHFDRGKKWNFVYKGFRINIIVKDDALMQKIDEGEKFAKGDAIRVRLRILQRYNKSVRAYENKSYRIMEFLEHISAPQEPILNL